MSTLIIVSVSLPLLAALILLWAWFLRVVLRLARVEEVTTHRIAMVTGVVVMLGFALTTFLYLASSRVSLPLWIAGPLTVAVILIPCFAMKWIFKTSFRQAFQTWMTTLLVPIAILVFHFIVLCPFLIEAFIVPTNGMAPTLLGNHWQGTCEECGNPAFCSPLERRRGFDSTETPAMICRDNFHVTRPTGYEELSFHGDRILVAKYLTPERWDLVVFRYPEDPSIYFAQRLVGMPGEEITIQDGRVLANGEILTPPDSIRGIEYLSKMPFLNGPLWGSPERPAKLGDDEYFTLGDFSANSKDSRLWSKGAPGHPPYAVPESYIHGVVTHIYWPFHRWRTLR